MTYAEPSVNRTGRSQRKYAPFLWVLRALLIALALQLGGMIHGTADLLGAVGVLAGEHEQCPPDGACDDCLAGCPNCHCAAALRTVAPDASWSVEPAHGAPDLALCVRSGSSAPLGPTLDSVYRPPRADLRFDFIG
jgi:hypothetical protein